MKAAAGHARRPVVRGGRGGRHPTVFIGRPSGPRMSRDDEPMGSRYPCGFGPSRARICSMCAVLAALPVGYAIVTGLSDWYGVAALLATFGGGSAFIVLVGRIEAHKRRILCAAARIMFLAGTLPRRTDEETLAVVGEIRARYAEAREMAEEFGDDSGRRLADDLGSRLDRIDRAYDAEAGRLRSADASAADLARDVRRFSRRVDVRQVI